MIPMVLANKVAHLFPRDEMLLGAYTGELLSQLPGPSLMWLPTMVFCLQRGYGPYWYAVVMVWLCGRQILAGRKHIVNVLSAGGFVVVMGVAAVK